MEPVSSVAMTALELRCSQGTLLEAAPQIEGMIGGRHHTKNLLGFQDSHTGSMMSSVSTTAACGQKTASITSHTDRLVTAEHIVLQERVTRILTFALFIHYKTTCPNIKIGFTVGMINVLKDTHRNICQKSKHVKQKCKQ